MPIRNWMIYGAYGYSARLIAERAKERGLAPVLAGRDAGKTRDVAREFGFPWRAFALDTPGAIADNLADIDAVVHCAGPFSATSAPMLEACLAAKAHYFDITGEMHVFEHAHSAGVGGRARDAGVVVCPGVGFDVVPTDCIARTLAEALPGATELALGFQGDTRVSPGTAKTMIEGLGYGTWARRDGKLVPIPLDVREIDYGAGPRQSMSVSWGDVSTAFYTTGIGNITVFWPASDSLIRKVRRAELIRPLLRRRWIQNFLKKQVDKRVRGPSAEKRAERDVRVWGEVRNAAGDAVTARMTTANGYTVTALAPVAIIEYLLANDLIGGSTTPALLMGKGFAGQLPGSSGITLSR
jgi:short subunit dehydrogenase-like uncharacterized protein